MGFIIQDIERLEISKFFTAFLTEHFTFVKMCSPNILFLMNLPIDKNVIIEPNKLQCLSNC